MFIKDAANMSTGVNLNPHIESEPKCQREVWHRKGNGTDFLNT
jgi:hypothetical protein